MTQKQLISFFFIALLVFIFFQVSLILSPFFKPIFWAALLAFGFYPLHERILRRLKRHEHTAAILTTLIIFAAFVPAAILIVVSLMAEAVKLYGWILSSIEDGSFGGALENFRSLGVVKKFETLILQRELLKENSELWAASLAKNMAGFTARQAGMLTKNAFLGVVNFLLAFFLVFFFLKDGNKIYRFVYDITPLERENKNVIFQEIHEAFAAVIRGQILTALAQAVTAGLVFWALGLPLPFLFAAATFLLSLIPVLGAAAVWVPLVIYLVSLQQYWKAGILFLLGAGVISLLDNFLKPVLIGEKTKLPYLLLFLGILGGMRIYGLIGLFAAPALLSLFFVLTKIYRQKFLRH